VPNAVRVLRALHAGYSAARASQPPRPPHLGRATKTVLVAGIGALLVVAMNAPGEAPSGWRQWVRIGAAAVLLPAGSWLTVRARRLPAQRRFTARAIDGLLELSGVVMLAVGVLELVLALV
jgi:hypothetical protein